MATTYGPNVIKLMQQLQALLNQDGITRPNPKPMERKAVPDKHMLRSITTCPRCGRRGRVGATFGVRDMGGGRLRPQSYCRDCRKDPNRPEALAWIHRQRRGRK